MAHVFFDPHRKSRERTFANLPDGRMFLTLRIYLNRTRGGPGPSHGAPRPGGVQFRTSTFCKSRHALSMIPGLSRRRLASFRFIISFGHHNHPSSSSTQTLHTHSRRPPSQRNLNTLGISKPSKDTAMCKTEKKEGTSPGARNTKLFSLLAHTDRGRNKRPRS